MSSILDTVTEQQIQDAVNTSYNLTDAMKKLGYVQPRAKNYKSFKVRCGDLGIDISHLIESTSNPLNHKRYSLEEIFIENSPVCQDTVRKRYKQENYTEYKCAICGINQWNNKDITLRLDHINGNKTDNRLENLRWVCPNCDSQLDTYCNKGHKTIYYCCDCGTIIATATATRCEECAKKAQRKVKERPSREELKQLIRNNTFVSIGKKYNVSDNTIRKWCLAVNLPTKKVEIKKYTNEEWELI